MRSMSICRAGRERAGQRKAGQDTVVQGREGRTEQGKGVRAIRHSGVGQRAKE
jgi:hypothetical protein